MRRKKRNLFLIIFLFLLWLTCTVVFMFVGYCIAGAIPVINIEMSYFDRFLMVASSPLDGYFNEYTPIGMIVGFILCEIIFALIICIKNQKPKRKSLDNEEMEEYLGQSEEDSDLVHLFNDKKEDASKKTGILSAKEQKTENEGVTEEQLEESEENLLLQEQTFLELFSSGYSMPQITEMMELTKYIKNLDILLLKKMFHSNMSPEDIRKHIESFYG